MLIRPEVHERAWLRLICAVIAIFTRTMRNSQRPSIIIIYRRSPNSYLRILARTHTHAALTPTETQSISLHYGAPLAVPRFFLTLPWTMIGHVTSILVDLDSRRLARARVNASPGSLLTFVNRADDIAHIGRWPFREQNRGIREWRRRDRSIDRSLFDRAPNGLGTCGPARGRNPLGATRVSEGSISH